jgi:MSHA type pilus biogenesis protein MshL
MNQLSTTILLLVLSACHTLEFQPGLEPPPLSQMTKKQIKESLLEKPAFISPQIKPLKNNIEKLSLPPNLNKSISLSTIETIPLKDLFFQIAQQADFDFSIDPGVKGGLLSIQQINLLLDIVRELCALNNLRYRIEHNILRIEPDKPYLVNYNAQFLSLMRQNQTRISVATDIFSASEGQHGSVDNGSNTLLTGEAKNDFWKELDSNLSTILKSAAYHSPEADQAAYSIHKQAGIISVYGTQAQHQQIEQFLKMLRASISSQVLIEAKIIEVILKDEFKAGINWNLLKGDLILQSPFGDTITPGSFNKNATPLRDVFTFGSSGKQLTEILSLINKFGTVRTLSSPRLIAMNNEPGVMKVATNHVYFRINYNRDYGYDAVREHEYVSSEVHTVPIGLIMVVHPSINFTNGSIILSLRPTISRVVDEKADPAVAIVSKETQQSYIPVVRKQEFESLVSIKSGDLVVMGGLMEEVAKNNQSGVPYFSEIPFIGNLAKAQSEDSVISELVVLLKATIVDNKEEAFLPLTTDTISPADARLYQTFIQDPRPLTFEKEKDSSSPPPPSKGL